MNASVVAVGLALLAVGLGLLYAARHGLARLAVPDEVLNALRLVAAVAGGTIITIGLAVVILGLVPG